MRWKSKKKSDNLEGSNGSRIELKSALEQCEAKAAMLDIVPTTIMGVDREFNVTYMNKVGAQAVGRSQDACIGQKCFSLFNTEHCNTPNCQVAKAMQQDGVFTSDTIARLPSGNVPIRYTATPIKDEEGNITGAIEFVLDITKEMIPVAPAAHYTMGGIKTNSWGETNIAGLFATGETACTGVHGANRLASNSMLEVVVFSKRITEKTRAGAETKAPIGKGAEVHHQLSQRPVVKDVSTPSLSALQQLLWDKVGIIRDKESLTEAADTLAAWQKCQLPPTDRPSYELNNLILTGRLVTEAALLREESRGAHFRSDFPQSSPQWQRHIIFTIK